MGLAENIKSNLTTAMKERNEVKKNVLRVVLGEVSTSESRSGKKMTDDEVAKVIRKVIQGNDETLSYLMPENENFTKLTEENYILKGFLPTTMTLDEMKQHIAYGSGAVIQEVKAAKSDGQAVGVLMRFFKMNGKNVLGEDVKELAQHYRA